MNVCVSVRACVRGWMNKVVGPRDMKTAPWDRVVWWGKVWGGGWMDGLTDTTYRWFLSGVPVTGLGIIVH